MERLNVGIIGIGNIGTAHAQALADGMVENVKLYAVCDICDERRDFCNQNFQNVKCFSDWRELLNDSAVDAVIISVPHRMHSVIAKEFLKKGKHVLVEKPIDVSISAAEELNNIAQKSDSVFAIMFQQRTNPVFQKAHELVKSGALGEIKRSVWVVTNWYRTQAYYDSGDWRATWSGEGGGVLLNQAPHNMDLWQWICGIPSELTAFCDVAKYHDIEVEDDVTLFARYENGATGTFITSTGEYPGTNRLEISGDRGKIVIENGTLKWWKLPVKEREFCFQSQESFPDIGLEYEEFSLESKENAHIKVIRNFADAIINGAPLIAPGIEGINELMISNAAYLSSWNGSKTVKLPPDAEEFDRLLKKHADESCGHKSVVLEPKARGYCERWQVKW